MGSLHFNYHFQILHGKCTPSCLHSGLTIAPALDEERLEGPEPGGIQGRESGRG